MALFCSFVLAVWTVASWLMITVAANRWLDKRRER